VATAFVTGITGQDGSYLTERLLADGFDVHGLVHPSDQLAGPFRAQYPSVVCHEGDLADPVAVAALIDRLEPDEIYNLAGISSVALSWEKPLLTAAITGVGAGGVFEGAWQLQQRLGRPVRVLQASSAEIFGFPEDVPQTEKTPISPRNPYGAAKAFAHHLVGVYRTRSLPISSCILYNHESPRRPTTFVTRKITEAAARIAAGRQDHLSLGTLDVRRDWGWAPDYVDAMCLAIRHTVADEYAADDYIVATGESHTVADFVAAAFAHVGISDWSARVRIDEAFARPADAPELVGDPAKAYRELGWKPTVTFGEMVARMVEADQLALRTS
jgi:GDPmannose 4,6-dehydratase